MISGSGIVKLNARLQISLLNRSQETYSAFYEMNEWDINTIHTWSIIHRPGASAKERVGKQERPFGDRIRHPGYGTAT
jgi:hypothetical protein